jgi:hypothetical protein
MGPADGVTDVALDVGTRRGRSSFRVEAQPGRATRPRPKEDRMKYLLMIYSDEHAFEAMSEDERHEVYAAYDELMKDLAANGHMLGGDELAPTSTATTVQVRGGERMVTDGPFAETKEQLGGYFLIDVDDLDAAIDIAARIPSVHSGSIEVRPIAE